MLEASRGKLINMHHDSVKLINSGDFKGALKIAKEIKNLGSNWVVSNVLGGLLIDIGERLNDESISAEGLALLKKDYETMIDNGIPIESVCYNIANGYSVLFGFKYRENKKFYFFRTTELDVATCYFRTALKYNSNKPELLTNIANCLDRKGRVMEALEYYDEALDIDPNHPMALGNKALALYNFARLSGETGTFLIESYKTLSKALKLNITPESKQSFLKIQKLIEGLFKDKKILNKHLKSSKPKIDSKSDLERYYIEFCLLNKLYLNYCTVCQRCDKSIGDPIKIKSMLSPIGEIDPNDFSESTPYYRLSAYLNQIKQDYITARFLLVLSRYDKLNLNFVDKKVGIINTLDYSIYNVYIQLLKFSFKNLFDILDKISFFINDYLDLGINPGYVNFSNLWYNNHKKAIVNEKILKTENPNLNALFDIHKDFDKGPYKELKNIRNSLTHKFIKVKMFSHLKTKNDMTEEDLFENTLELCKIVRNSVIYLLNFVNMEEFKKKEKSKDNNVGSLYVENIPDELKSDR